ncbi:MAG: DUF3825 domain-containing protein [Clostridiaceae bacterium]|nr:DUF3825 domain-containing protein [Clostridiaceae bacterium]
MRTISYFALVLSMDNSTGVPFYMGTTILTVEIAYLNARLLAKPDNPGLFSAWNIRNRKTGGYSRILTPRHKRSGNMSMDCRQQ